MKYLMTVLGLVFSINANATLMTLSFDDTDYGVNDVITGQLIASNFTETLGGFDAEISFDDSVLALTGWSFGNGFDDGFGSLQFADDMLPGSLLLSDFSFLFSDEMTLAANQGAEFVLASFTFTALSAGMHSVSLLDGAQIVSFDNTTLETMSAATASFNVTEVPEPATGLLLLAGLAAFLRRAK